jgi:Fe-S-cluster containining protein
MGFDLTPFFERYEGLVDEVDMLFQRIATEYPECVKCGVGCSDCCHALFDLSLIEALYLNHKFVGLDESERRPILEFADSADRESYRIKKELYKRQQQGEETNGLLLEAASRKVRCPLLIEDQTCLLYSCRPITCRVYGIPMNIGGKAHTCGFSGFEQGRRYPAVAMEKIQGRLLALSHELVISIHSKHVGMESIFVPVSMALLTTYDDAYLGIPAEGVLAQGKGPATWELSGPSEEEG